MSSAEEVSADKEPTKGELVETIRGMQARMERLEEENEELRDEIDQMKVNYTTESTLNQLLAALVGSEHVDFSADPFENREVLEDVRERLESVETQTARLESDSSTGSKTSGPDQAWTAIVEKARNLQTSSDHGLPNNRVQLHKEDIVGATGRSERQAGNYIDYFGGDEDADGDLGKHAKRGADRKPYRPPSDGQAARKKALVVDLDVWGEDA